MSNGRDGYRMPGNESPPPGWYPNPSGAKGKLWWTGTEWTQGPPPKVTEPIGLKKILIICGSLLAVIFVISLFQDSDDEKIDTASTSTSRTQTQVSGSVTQTYEAPSPAPQTGAPAPVAPAPEPAVDPEDVVRIATEQAFLKTINDSGISMEDERAVLVANAACVVAFTNPSWGPARLAAEIRSVEPSLTPQESAYFAGAATKAYCPEDFDRIFGEG